MSGWKTPSQQEREVLVWVATGATNAEIAKGMWLSPDTVKTHLRNMSIRYNAASRTHLVAMALRARWIE